MAHDHEHFLAALAHDPADIATWQIFADFLEEQGDPTCEFIRLSLDLSVGKTPHGSAEASIGRFEALWPAAIYEVRELLASYRSSLPIRFRVIDWFQLGSDPPQDMFAYERTVAVGYLEAGTLTAGMDLGVGKRANGQPRRLTGMESFRRSVGTAAPAGTEPLRLGLAWDGHFKIEVGVVLTVASN